MPTVVEFSTWMAVGPCVHPISERVVRMGTDVWALMKMVPYSASAADAMILRMIFHTTSKMPLVVGWNFWGQVGLRRENELHWLGFLLERLKGRRRLNGWPIASHLPSVYDRLYRRSEERRVESVIYRDS